MFQINWAGLILPVLYVVVLVASVYTIYTLYQKHQLGISFTRWIQLS